MRLDVSRVKIERSFSIATFVRCSAPKGHALAAFDAGAEAISGISPQ